MIHAQNGQILINGNAVDVLSELATIVGTLKRNGIPTEVIQESFDLGIKHSITEGITHEPYHPEESVDSFDRIFGEFFK